MGQVIGHETTSEAFEWLKIAFDKHTVILEDVLGFSETLSILERSYGVKMSSSAVLLLVVPILERVEMYEHSDRKSKLPTSEELRETLEMIVQGVATEPVPFDYELNRVMGETQEELGIIRSTLSVIKQFWKNFCNMPPFCGETENHGQ